MLYLYPNFWYTFDGARAAVWELIRVLLEKNKTAAKHEAFDTRRAA